VSNGTKGRMAVAKKDLKLGEIVCEDTGIIAGVLHLNLWDSRCAFCFQTIGETAAGGRCSCCKLVRYCSREHQRLDFNQGHKKECKQLNSMVQLCGPRVTDALLAFRILRGGTQAVTAAMDLVKTRNKSETTTCRQIAFILAQVFGLPAIERNVLFELLCRFSCNNFAFCDNLYISIGASVFPTGAILNHSCKPNCIVSYAFNPLRQVIRCNVDFVKAGEELCHAYCDTAWPKQRRLTYLQEVYGFQCDCLLCSGADLTREKLEAEEFPLENCNENEVDDVLVAKFKALSNKDRSRVKMLEVVGAALRAALYLGDFKTATEASESLISIYNKIYSPNHPLIGLQLHTYADLLHSTSNDASQTRLIARRAANIVRVTQAEGEKSAFYLDLDARATAG